MIKRKSIKPTKPRVKKPGVKKPAKKPKVAVQTIPVYYGYGGRTANTIGGAKPKGAGWKKTGGYKNETHWQRKPGYGVSKR